MKATRAQSVFPTFFENTVQRQFNKYRHILIRG